MPSIDNIELSEDEILMAEDMGLEDYINYEEPRPCNECGMPTTPGGNICRKCSEKYPL